MLQQHQLDYCQKETTWPHRMTFCHLELGSKFIPAIQNICPQANNVLSTKGFNPVECLLPE